MSCYQIYSSKLGALHLVCSEDGLETLSFQPVNLPLTEHSNEQMQQAFLWLDEFVSGKAPKQQLKLNPQGTPFQKEVWKALLEVEFGKTESYQALSNRLGNPKAIRAVAAANGANPIAIVIPCHRIIGTDGGLTGYAGGLANKKLLLEHEAGSSQLNLF